MQQCHPVNVKRTVSAILCYTHLRLDVSLSSSEASLLLSEAAAFRLFLFLCRFPPGLSLPESLLLLDRCLLKLITHQLKRSLTCCIHLQVYGDDLLADGSLQLSTFSQAEASVPDLGLWRPLGNNIIEKTSTP